MKAERRRLIHAILRSEEVTSQTELATLLRARGQRVTQATLSRDLVEMGAFKARGPGGRVAYRLPEEPPASDEHLRRMLLEFVDAVTPTGNLVVLRTPPGCAQPVARALDTAGLRDIVGTIAGDDTILCVCRDGVRGRTLAKRIETLMTTTSAREAVR